MSNQDWTSKLQDQLAGYQESVSHDLWAGIEQSLAQNDIESVSSNPQAIVSESSESSDFHVGSEAKKKARIVYFKRWSAAAAAVALLGIGGSYIYLHQEEVEKGNLQLASLSSRVVSADLPSAAPHTVSSDLPSAPSHAVSSDLPSAASHVVSSDLPSAAPQKKKGNVLEKESENKISLLADNHAAAYASQSYHFDKNEEVSGWSMQLYAENLTSSLGGVNSDASGSYRDYSYGTMAEPMPGVIPDPTAGGIYGEEYLLASCKAIQRNQQVNAKHHAPVSVGLQVAFGIAPRLSLSTGMVYTRTSSDFYPYASSNSYNVHQVLHYVGIPVGLNYEFWQSGGFHAYLMAGAEADYNVKNDTEEEGVKKENAKRDRVQFSGKASLGAQYDITPKVGLYIEPGAKYYFDNGSHVENTFKDKKLNFNLQFGLRFNL
ncbi:PorT family protein [Prevotella sp. AM34-19LB]|uniref:outer membrane beta-barrel protein n=1 Tax=Prevotella sp. AM34-19LB TaxID=2292364 RepID=UPI000E5CE57E|nr:outer membrane beta-barrel protein [Prevotella sp. AM34-19LB]RHC76449.1 PorT family protein [Prevotella sp. AM34-19LB]